MRHRINLILWNALTPIEWLIVVAILVILGSSASAFFDETEVEERCARHDATVEAWGTDYVLCETSQGRYIVLQGHQVK